MSLIDTIKTGREENPARIIVYGTNGVGKSTFAAGAKKPVFIQTEDGLGRIDCAKFPLCKSFEDVKAQLVAVRDEAHDFSSLVIDTLDWCETLIWHDVIQRGGRKKISDFPYGQGYDAALVEWQGVTRTLDEIWNKRRMNIVLLAHSKVEKMNDPENGEYDRWSPRLYKTANAHLCEWADAILFATTRVVVDSASGKARPIGEGGGERYIRTVGTPAVVAKNRFDLPEEIGLSWASFTAGIGKNPHT